MGGQDIREGFEKDTGNKKDVDYCEENKELPVSHPDATENIIDDLL